MAGTVQVPFGYATVTRIVPAGRASDYKTYGMSFPRETHWRPATCEEVVCLNWANGWKTILPADHDQVPFIRSLSRQYSFTEQPADGGLVEFTFAAGQPCFKASTHRVRLERQPVMYVAGGDWRGNPRGTQRTVHARPEDWVEDFADHQDKLATALQRG